MGLISAQPVQQTAQTTVPQAAHQAAQYSSTIDMWTWTTIILCMITLGSIIFFLLYVLKKRYEQDLRAKIFMPGNQLKTLKIKDKNASEFSVGKGKDKRTYFVNNHDIVWERPKGLFGGVPKPFLYYDVYNPWPMNVKLDNPDIDPKKSRQKSMFASSRDVSAVFDSQTAQEIARAQGKQPFKMNKLMIYVIMAVVGIVVVAYLFKSGMIQEVQSWLLG